MGWKLGAALVLVLGLACGSPSASEEGGGSTSDEGTSAGTTAGIPDCAVDPDFTPCGEAQVCLAGACVQRIPCAPGQCASGLTFAIPDTNVRACFGPSPDGMDGTIACPGQPGAGACAGTNYCGQDAQYGWDVEHEPSERFSLQAGDDPLVVDEVTGLEWQGCSAGQAGAACAGEATLMSWYDADAYCNDASWAGHDDWVLPNSFALQSITDYGTTSPAIDASVFVNAPSKFDADYDQWWIECVWSSSSYAGDSDVAWALMVNSGDVAEGSGLEYHLNDKAADGWPGCYTRCVRTPAAAAWQRFVRIEPVAGEPIVVDHTTERMWQGCSLGQSGSECQQDASMVDWLGALAACEDLSWGGYDDWYLPNVKELRSIVDEGTQSPAIDTLMFPATPFYGADMTLNIGQYWSSTARSYNDFALYVDFSQGFSHFYEQPEGRHVRCVRDP